MTAARKRLLAIGAVLGFFVLLSTQQPSRQDLAKPTPAMDNQTLCDSSNTSGYCASYRWQTSRYKAPAQFDNRPDMTEATYPVDPAPASSGSNSSSSDQAAKNAQQLAFAQQRQNQQLAFAQQRQNQTLAFAQQRQAQSLAASQQSAQARATSPYRAPASTYRASPSAPRFNPPTPSGH